jgi:putative ABC transport system permease protein
MGWTRAIRWLHLRRLVRQPLRAALAVIVIGAGVSLAIAVTIESTSLHTATTRFGRRLAGPAPLRVVGATTRGGLSPDVVGRVAAVPGVKAAVPIVQAVTLVETATGTQSLVMVFGVDCSVEALIGPIGCSPEAIARSRDDNPPIVSARLARKLGPGARIRTDTGLVNLAHAPSLPQLDTLNHGDVAVFPLPVAQRRLGREGRVDVIYILPTGPGDVAGLRRRIAAAAGPQSAVLSATDPPPGPDISGPIIPLLGIVGFIALAIGGQLIYNIVALSLAERRRDLAITAAVGASARHVVGGTVVEAVVLGLLGGLAGTVGGVIVARPLLASLSTFTRKFIGLGVGLTVPPYIVLYGAVLGAVVAAAAAVLPARRASRREVAAELHGQASLSESAPRVTRGRAVVYLGAGLAGVALTQLGARRGGLAGWQAPTATVGMFLALIAMFAAAGAVVPVILDLARRTRFASRGAVRIALANLVREGARTQAMAIAVAIAIGIAGLLAGFVSAIHDETATFTAAQYGQSLSVGTLAFNDTASIDAKTPPAVIAAIARMPGVAYVGVEVFISTGHHANDLIAVVANDHERFPYRIIAGRPGPEVFARGEVIVGLTLARARHLHPGSTLTVPAPGGLARLKVGAIWENINNVGRAVTVPMSTATALWGPQPPDIVTVTPKPGVRLEVLAARIRAAHLDPDLKVDTPSQLAQETSASITAYLSPFWTLQRALLVVAFIAVLSTLLLAGIQRRRELGILAAVGMDPVDLGRMTLIEGGVVGLLGGTLGAVVALPLLAAMANYALFFIGIEIPLRYNVLPVAGYIGLALVVVLVGAALPAWRTARLPVLEALQYE